MFKPHSDKPYLPSGKVIEIKPIDHLKQHETNHKASLDDEIKLAQYSLQKAKGELKATKQQKEHLLQNAIAEIENEKQQWESEKQILKENVTAQAYHDGLERGKQESLTKYKHMLEEANSIINAAKEDYNQTLDESEQMIARLAVHIAEKIIKQSIREKPEQFLSIVKAAITEIKDQSVISIYLHPENYTTVMEQKEELQPVLNGDTKISIYIDHGLKKNSCIIEHPLGQVDASVDTQLEEIRNVLMDIAKEHKS